MAAVKLDKRSNIAIRRLGTDWDEVKKLKQKLEEALGYSDEADCTVSTDLRPCGYEIMIEWGQNEEGRPTFRSIGHLVDRVLGQEEPPRI